MDYLCMMVQREVAEKSYFATREQAAEYFFGRYGELFTGKPRKNKIRQDNYFEKKQDLRELVFSGEREDLLHLAGICQEDGKCYVAEEKYSWIGIKSSSEKGVLDVRESISEEVAKQSLCLEICKESEDAIEGIRKKLRKMATNAKREFRKHVICDEKTEKFS